MKRLKHPGTSNDPLGDQAWRALSTAIIAASQLNANDHANLFRRWPGEASDEGRRACLYLWYLLRYRVAEILGRLPTPEDLRNLAVQLHPQFARLIRGDESRLEATLRTLFETTTAEDHVRGGMFLILGTALLGVLLDDAEPQLAAMRPHLDDWWQRNAGRFGELGVS